MSKLFTKWAETEPSKTVILSFLGKAGIDESIQSSFESGVMNNRNRESSLYIESVREISAHTNIDEASVRSVLETIYYAISDNNYSVELPARRSDLVR